MDDQAAVPRDDAARETQAHKMAECNRCIRILQAAGVAEDIIEQVRCGADV